ncbi:hypothetical protein [Comamonas endophytica]|uniref:Uncharacterized protein n=1 Tax=Comamonas endophytica TaxID=2949090 RepID=A0ABY6GE79_9BURK|nr:MULTISPECIES: hypothetical protein [unclassified Acidovorax]MCD2511766.1 hypothetical protein [Acidovorax sp. D4N7]UYG53360.1 hypothetical protein M9799_15755 [Acidovorax sp. 5MLIR]
MQFALQALPYSRHAQNDMLFGQSPAALDFPSLPLTRVASKRPAPRPASLPQAGLPVHSGVRILRNEGQTQGGRLLMSGRMADVCAALNRMEFNEYACG